MTIADYDAVFDLWKNTPGMGLNTLDDSMEGIAKYLRRNPTTCFVAKEGGRLLGVILAGHDGRRAFIHHLAVDKRERKRGLGKALVERAMEALEAEGIAKVAFVVMKDNGIGNAFWERMGFSRRDDLVYRNKTITKLEMKKIETS